MRLGSQVYNSPKLAYPELTLTCRPVVTECGEGDAYSEDNRKDSLCATGYNSVYRLHDGALQFCLKAP